MTVRAPHSVSVALVLGGVHALVDAASVFILFRDLPASGAAPLVVSAWIVAYDVIGFAAQAPLGLLADRRHAYRRLALTGLGLVAAALLGGPFLPRAAAALAGLGNALFHTGAGALVLRGSGERAREAGLFVGPGALGLLAGILLGRSTLACRPFLALLLLAATAATVLLTKPRLHPAPTILRPLPLTRAAIVGLVLLLCTVTLRSVIGDTLAATWRAESIALTVALAVAACTGKMLGGALADRCGWSHTALVALAAASLLALRGFAAPAAAVATMLLLQTTMPLTLKAVHLALPDRPGLAFGLPSLVLLLGAMPGLLGAWPLASWPALTAGTALSAGAVFLGLRALRAGAAPRS